MLVDEAQALAFTLREQRYRVRLNLRASAHIGAI
jgi:hypothetical protein